MMLIKNRRVGRLVIAALMVVMTAGVFLTGLMMEEVDAATILRNPRIVEDASMKAGQKVTWDCVWFGSYPQSEVVYERDYDSIANLRTMNSNFGVEFDTVSESTWNSIVNADYDSNGDAEVGGEKYRRIRRVDTTYSNSGLAGYYDWNYVDTYHYFIYEPIKWRVLDVNGNDAFLLSDKSLDSQRYNTSYLDVTWEMSTIRSWLNGYDSSENKSGVDYSSKNFIGSAFTTSECSAIKTTNVINDKNITYDTPAGVDTSDKIFLLSENEIYNSDSSASYGFTESSSTYDESRRCKSSTFTKAMGAYSCIVDSAYLGNCWWWLRSPASIINSAVSVGALGNASSASDNYVDKVSGGIRPALHLDLSYSDLCSYAGTVCNDGSVKEESSSIIKPDTDKDDDPVFARVAGDSRYDTSTAAADALMNSLGVDKFDNIIVASGSDYPDALAGSYLAKVKNAPVVLVGKDTVTEYDVKQYISRNLKEGGTPRRRCRSTADTCRPRRCR